MNKLPILAMIIAGAGLSPVIASAAPNKPAAKLSMADARVIALKKAPGKIADAGYENEGGGWRYSFDIR